MSAFCLAMAINYAVRAYIARTDHHERRFLFVISVLFLVAAGVWQ